MRIRITDHPGPDRDIQCEACVLAFARRDDKSEVMRYGTDEGQVRMYSAFFRHLATLAEEMPGLLDAARSEAGKADPTPSDDVEYEVGERRPMHLKIGPAPKGQSGMDSDVLSVVGAAVIDKIGAVETFVIGNEMQYNAMALAVMIKQLALFDKTQPALMKRVRSLGEAYGKRPDIPRGRPKGSGPAGGNGGDPKSV